MAKSQYKYHIRLKQLIYMTLLVMVFFSIKMFLEGDVLNTFVVVFSTLSLATAPLLLHQGKQDLAALVLIGVISLSVLTLMWIGAGIKDSAILGLPGVLVFTVMIGALRLFKWVLLLFAGSLLAMGWASSAAFVTFAEANLGLNAAINTVIILLLVGFATRIMARDYLVVFDEMEKNFALLERAKAAVEHQALHDQLTGLPNRLSAEQHFERAIAKVRRSGNARLGLLYIDLDEFKDINDEYGHETGDRYLVEKSQQLKQCLRQSDVVCRIGGDEFLVLIDDIESDSLATIAAKIHAVLAESVAIEGRTFATTGSIGIVIVPDDADRYDIAVKRADIAMYRAKEQGKNQFHFYDSALEARVHRRLALQNHFVEGLANQEFAIYLQPIYSIESGRQVGAEVLARWTHPSLGVISPDEFIPLAESNGFIHVLGDWVLEQACNWLSKSVSAVDVFYLSVNVSPLQLKQASFLDRLRHCLTCYDVNAKHLKLEVTESQFIEADDNLSTMLQEIHALGIGLFLDDFGTGFSNLAQLQKMQFETIKIDRSFVSDCSVYAEKPPLLRAIVSLATELNVKLVAEGVETEDEAQVLRQLGITFGQGYLWQKPTPTQAFERQLKDQFAPVSK